MRKVILGLGISLDGYIARKNNAVDWLSMDWEYDWTAFFKTIDVVLMGRKSWEVALGMNPKKKSKLKPSNPYAGMETYVFSKTLKESGVEGVEIVSSNLKEFVENLKAKDGKHIWLSGGGELAKSFLDENLVDEIYLGITPLLLGSGLPLFPELIREVPLRFVSSKTYEHKKEDNRMVELLYEVKKD
ncbi:MAG: dihydrofolate reductase family protein [Acidobacteria bacterium]|nr:dihydrofolate reductase family protein [Acidobacteriota bacterium]MCA1638314.1 dihydrofolate reductase family protein [Acidobacteriota bacterium]